ncbi:MAG: winged helix-turn-helix domain-containing protein [candidate division NC10 bacterium]|nr:winged helix-turn-helix domain-containing protein [candidate division NC10 bacterium]
MPQYYPAAGPPRHSATAKGREIILSPAGPGDLVGAAASLDGRPPSSPRPSGRLLEATAEHLAFRRQGLLTIARRRILIRDPAGLHALA